MPSMKNDIMLYKMTAIMGGMGIGWLDSVNDLLKLVALSISIIVGVFTLIEKIKSLKK